MSRRQARQSISQLYHGELATRRLCGELLDSVTSGPARDCLAIQMTDERRHATAYARYLEPLGGLEPVSPILSDALEGARRGPFGPLGAILAYHVVLESEVLRVHGALAQLLPCPLLAQINRLVARDEARHVAFGRHYLRDAVAATPQETRRRLYDWIQGLWRRSSDQALERYETSGLARSVLRPWLQGGWRHHDNALQQVGLLAAVCERRAP